MARVNVTAAVEAAQARSSALMRSTDRSDTPERAVRGSTDKVADAAIIQPESLAQVIMRSGRVGPEELTTMTRSAALGRPRDLCSYVDNVRRHDGHIQDVFGVMEDAISSLRLACVVPRTTPMRSRAATGRAADRLQAALSECSTFVDMLCHQISAGLLYERALSETLWTVSQREMIPSGFTNVDPRRFMYRRADTKLLFDPTGKQFEGDGIDWEERWGKDAWVSNYPRVTGGQPTTAGLGEFIAWFGLFRNVGVKSWIQLGESSWKPQRKATYKKAADKADKEIAKRALMLLSQNGSCLIPETITIDDAFPMPGSGGSDQHAKIIRWFASEISKAVLGTPDVIESDVTGARAATEVRAQLTTVRRDRYALGLSHRLTACLSAPYTRMNHGINVTPPAILLVPHGTEDIEKFAQAAGLLVDLDLGISKQDAYDRIGMNAPQAGEPLLKRISVTVPGTAPVATPPTKKKRKTTT